MENSVLRDIRLAWGLEKASLSERESWSYSYQLEYSPKFLIEEYVYLKEDLNKNKLKIKDVYLDKFGKLKIVLENGSLNSPTNLVLCKKNPFFKTEDEIHLHPSRGGFNLFKNGYSLNEVEYKKIYYKKEEYSKKFKKTMIERHGVDSPIKNTEIRKKISSTIKEKYGVNWFLERGSHYHKIQLAQLSKYGNDCFRFLGVSKFEIEVISEIITNLKQYFSDEIYFFSEENHQFCFDINNSKHPVDFYDKKKDIVIEVFGDTFHCNPKIYREDFFLSIKNKFAREIWSRDECVLGELRKQSRNVFVVWEKDWRENKDLVIENIKSKIK